MPAAFLRLLPLLPLPPHLSHAPDAAVPTAPVRELGISIELKYVVAHLPVAHRVEDAIKGAIPGALRLSNSRQKPKQPQTLQPCASFRPSGRHQIQRLVD